MRAALTAAADRATSSARNNAALGQLKGLATFERNLALLCVTIPLWLILFDDGPEAIRSSVSAYHDIARPQAYFFPMTVASMLFVYNGLVRSGRIYNTALGVLLAGVVLFDHDGASAWPHYAFAIGFFVLNGLVILWFAGDAEPWLRVVIIAAIAAGIAAWVLIEAVTTFWIEWVSLVAIALHFVLDSLGYRGYAANANRVISL